ncbi:MAG: hypothetical protein A2901_03140 [Elusimicrobia bacterium RIFCSPLOWO2_01_FULL_54_10]|nr:MAG: hypothetical protein A2901_03140 [Elusimicrobia bacterium RIFCSPLOWO2_01_FULL_54_10]
MSKTARLLILGMALLSASAAKTAPPPSVQTPEEKLWSELSSQARVNLNSQETLGLANKFIKLYPSYPKSVNAHYLLAEREFTAEKFQQSAALFEKFLQNFPGHELSDSANFRLGECYYNLKAYNSAQSAWEKVIRDHPTSSLKPNAMEFLALLYMRGGEWGRADEMWRSLTGGYSNFAAMERVKENYGVTLYHIKEYDRCAQILEGVVSSKGAYFRALSLFSLKLYDTAVASLQNFEFTKQGVYLESASYLKAEGFLQKMNYNLAAAEFGNFVRQFPSSSLALYATLRQATCLLFTGKYVEAVRTADRVLQSSPPKGTDVYALFVKASALMLQDNNSAAASLFAKVAAPGDFPDLCAAALLRKAWCERQLKNFQAQDETLKLLEEKYPASQPMAFGQFLRGVRLYELEKWDDAGRQFESGLIKYPYSAISEASLALMAVSYNKAGLLDRLITASNACLKILEGSYSSASVYWRAQSYFLIGKAYFDLDRFKDAVPYFEKISVNFTDHPLFASAQLHLAWSLLETQEYDKAREKAETLAEHKLADAEIRTHAKFLAAVSYFNQKDFDKALARLADFAAKNPAHARAPQAKFLIGLSFHQKGVFGSAIEEWTACIKKYPDHPLALEAHLHIGSLYFKAGKFSEAAKSFRNFRERWPNSKYTETAFWQELQSYFNGKDDETAIKIYPGFIEKFPGSENALDANKQLEMIYYRRGAHGDPDKIAQFLSKFPQSPFAPSARYKLGDMAMEQKKWNLAASEMEQFIRDYPNDPLVPEAEYALGQAYENAGLAEKAVIQYRNMIKNFSSRPGAVSAAFRLGSLFFAREKYQEALESFQFAVDRKLSPELKANLLFNIAVCYENLGQTENAGRAYARFAKAAKDPEQAREAWMSAGLFLKKAKKNKEAAECFGELLKNAGTKEKEMVAVNLMAECYQAAGKKSAAADAYEKLISMEPVANDARLSGLAQLAFIYETNKKIAQALAIYEKISVSGGKAEWVNAAKKRIEFLSSSLNPLP